MKVTDLDYALENKLLQKLDIMIKRCTNKRVRKDALLIVEGSEGEGKTNSSEAIAYYIKHKTKREIHMFFRLKGLIEFAKSTENKIIIWDEPALDSLSTDWWKETNKDLIRLLMTCRKKRHFFLFNFVKFYKFSEYVVVDRSLGLVHMYSRRGIIPGRFVYIRLNKMENLYLDYKYKKRRNYVKYKSFGGSFPIVEKKLHLMGMFIEGKPNCTLEDYERLKDKSIDAIGSERKKLNPFREKLTDLKRRLGKLKFPITSQVAFGNLIGYDARTLYNWGKTEDPPYDGSQKPESRAIITLDGAEEVVNATITKESSNPEVDSNSTMSSGNPTMGSHDPKGVREDGV